MVVKKDIASMHGIPMTEEAFEQLIHVESSYRYELIGGFAFDSFNPRWGPQRNGRPARSQNLVV